METQQILKLPENNGIMLITQRTDEDDPWVDDEDDDAVDSFKKIIKKEKEFLNNLLGYEAHL